MAYIKQNATVTGGDFNVQQAPSNATSFLSTFLTNAMQQGKTQKEMSDYYDTLRKAGYSPEEASRRVNQQSKGGFLRQILSRNQSGFTPPADSSNDPYAADVAKTKAQTAEAQAKADYYKKGGPKRTVIDKMTPNQLQQRLKYLTRLPNSDDQAVQEEINYINAKLQESAGYKTDQSQSQAGAKQGAYQVGQVITTKSGKKYRIVDLSDPNDPTVEPVPTINNA